MRYETENTDDTVTDGEITSWSFDYNYPRVAGSPWVLQTNIDQTSRPTEIVTDGVVTSLYDSESWTASILASRWLNLRGPSRGWLVGTGVVWRRNSYEYRSGTVTDTFFEQNAAGLTAQVQFRDVRDYLFSRSGWQYGYQGEFGEPAIGADQHYTRHEFFYRHYILLPGRPHTNIDVQAKLGLSSGEIFTSEEYAYALGGSKSLRGFDRNSLIGDAYVLLNVQYLQPLFGYNALRGVVFLDVGNAYPSNTELHLGDLGRDVGVGLRLRLKSFVKIDRGWTPPTRRRPASGRTLPAPRRFSEPALTAWRTSAILRTLSIRGALPCRNSLLCCWRQESPAAPLTP
ncbi:MAG: BamA/TamA family outer membrane protein [Comamonadaceae bacterium]|nr:BamA/TamA family outer membrane protein [Comamonadaceae bacterium]